MITDDYVPHPEEDYLGKTMLKNSTSRVMAAAGFDAQAEVKPTGMVITRSDDPKYRLMEHMAACGKTRRDIADTLGMSYSWVCQVFKQRWFKDNVIAVLKDNGRDHVQAFLKAECMPSLEVVRDIRDNESEKGATRLAAANTILDRLLGKPTNKIEVDGSLNINTVDKEAEQLLAEAKSLDEKLKARGMTVILSDQSN